ncbi:MAG: hypothetical protein ACM36B_17325 [Bacteroidota bacterium]
MGDADRRGGRILLAIDTGSLTAPALETASALAVGLNAGLAALFVEDERLLRIAGLPFARETGAASAELRTLGQEAMEQAFRVQARQLARVVEAAAVRLALQWSLDVARGELLAASRARLGPADLLVLGRGRLAAFPVGGWRSDGGPFRALAGRPVAWLFDESPGGERGLEAALALARVTAAELAVLVGAAGPEAFRNGQARAARRLEGRGAAARYALLATGDPHALVRCIRTLGAGALVLSGAAGAPPTVELLEDVACPVVLLP